MQSKYGDLCHFNVCERAFLDCSDFNIESNQQNGSLARINL